MSGKLSAVDTGRWRPAVSSISILSLAILLHVTAGPVFAQARATAGHSGAEPADARLDMVDTHSASRGLFQEAGEVRVDRFAAINYSPQNGDVRRNTQQLTERVIAAAKAGARYIVLPELALTGPLAPSRDGVPNPLAEAIPGPTTEHFSALAKQHGIWLAMSLAERTVDNDDHHVSSVLINARGKITLKLRKRVLRPNGEDGDAVVGFARLLMDTVDDGGRRIAVVSGDDLQNGVPRLANRGADTILVSANWAPEDPVAWLKLSAKLAKAYNLNLVVANRDPAFSGVYSRTEGRVESEPVQGMLVEALPMMDGAWKIPSSLGLPSVPIPTDQPFSPKLVELGRAMFFDQKLSSTGDVSCSTCHDPEKFFIDNKVLGEGVHDRPTRRNVPTILNAAFRTPLMWDGNPTTLEQQVKYPLTGFAELNLRSYDVLMDHIRSRPDYVEVFRSEMGIEAEEIRREHFAQAMSAFERTLISGNSPFDRYYYGDEKTALNAAARRGLELFTGKAACANCHLIGDDHAMFADSKFHTLGIGWVADKKAYADLGVGTVSNQDYVGRFFTPSLRNVAETHPYMHDGSIATLEEAIKVHFGGPDPDPAIPDVELTEGEIADLVEFMRSLTGEDTYTLRAERITPRDSDVASRSEVASDPEIASVSAEGPALLQGDEAPPSEARARRLIGRGRRF